jgi:hypothetical protein
MLSVFSNSPISSLPVPSLSLLSPLLLLIILCCSAVAAVMAVVASAVMAVLESVVVVGAEGRAGAKIGTGTGIDEVGVGAAVGV